MTEPVVSRRYRTLLAAHPRAWRERQGDVVLGTLLDVHAASGRRGPSLAERWSFLLDGLRLHLRSADRLPAGAAVPLAEFSMHGFDQGNGTTRERVLSEQEQTRANIGEMTLSGDHRSAVTAWIGFNGPPPRRRGTDTGKAR